MTATDLAGDAPGPRRRPPMTFTKRDLTPPRGAVASWRVRMAKAPDQKAVDALIGGVVHVELLATYLQKGKQREAAKELRHLLAVERAAYERTMELWENRPVYGPDAWAEAT